MTEDQMKNKLYDLYQLDWLMSHGYSLGDVFTVIRDAKNEAMECGDDDDPDVVISKFYEEGFSGEIFVCFGEFCDAELRDRDYVNHLLAASDPESRTKLYEAYMKFMEEAEA